MFYSSWDATIRLSVEGSGFDAGAAVCAFEGYAPPPGRFNDATCMLASSNALEFRIAPNTAYWIQIGGRNGATGGQLSLRVDCIDDCPTFGLSPPGGTPGTDYPGSSVVVPDTGSGGYLPRPKRP